MEQNIENKKNFTDKLNFFWRENKLKLLISLSAIFITLLFYIFWNINIDKKNSHISEKYIEAGLKLAQENNTASKQIFEEIILSKNKFYSVLALGSILDNDLEKSKVKILDYFKIVEDMSLSKVQKDLLIFKKALYLIKTSEVEKGNELLKKLIEKDSKYKSLAQDFLN
tara:strand:+ start:537 stop:1043 length:507 start_codon:yes stop_codon:yes gene_type:complete